MRERRGGGGGGGRKVWPLTLWSRSALLSRGAISTRSSSVSLLPRRSVVAVQARRAGVPSGSLFPGWSFAALFTSFTSRARLPWLTGCAFGSLDTLVTLGPCTRNGYDKRSMDNKLKAPLIERSCMQHTLYDRRVLDISPHSQSRHLRDGHLPRRAPNSIAPAFSRDAMK